MRTRYRNYSIWEFDGYYDVHPRNDDGGQPLVECFNTKQEAKRWIDDLVITNRLIAGRFTIR